MPPGFSCPDATDGAPANVKFLGERGGGQVVISNESNLLVSEAGHPMSFTSRRLIEPSYQGVPHVLGMSLRTEMRGLNTNFSITRVQDLQLPGNGAIENGMGDPMRLEPVLMEHEASISLIGYTPGPIPATLARRGCGWGQSGHKPGEHLLRGVQPLRTIGPLRQGGAMAQPICVMRVAPSPRLNGLSIPQ